MNENAIIFVWLYEGFAWKRYSWEIEAYITRIVAIS